MPTQLHGKSFLPLLETPNQEFKDVIYARFGNGESIKTNQYLYTEWFDKKGELYGRMLYDHELDPNENINISEFPENAAIVDSLSKILQNEMRAAFDINL